MITIIVELLIGGLLLWALLIFAFGLTAERLNKRPR
jgi:hypothetical protein